MQQCQFSIAVIVFRDVQLLDVVFLVRYWNAVFLYKDNLKYLQGTAYNLLRDFKLY